MTRFRTSAALDLRIGITALIPADYLPEPEIRIALYRRLLRLTDSTEVAEFADELIDRFGRLPAPAQALVSLAALRLRCCALGILRLEAGPKAVALEFEHDASLRRAAADLVADGAEVSIRGRRLLVPPWADRRQPDLNMLDCLLRRVRT